MVKSTLVVSCVNSNSTAACASASTAAVKRRAASTSVWSKCVKLALSAFVIASGTRSAAAYGVNAAAVPAFGACPSGAAAIRSIPFDLGSQILPPGCYAPSGAASFALTGKLTLNGRGSYSFHSESLTTAAGSEVILAHGALCDSVDWSFDAAATLGADSIFIGNIQTADAAAISIGAQTAVTGQVTAGTVQSGPGVITWGLGSSHKSCSGVKIDVPVAAAAAAPAPVRLASGTAANPTLLAAELSGLTLHPGQYRAIGDSAFHLGAFGRVILDGAGRYTFTTPGAITTGASSFIELRNGAQCSQINWISGGEVNIGASSTFAGNAQSGIAAAINLGASSVSRGTLRAGNGVINAGALAIHTLCSLAASSPLLSGAAPVCDAGSAPLNGVCTFCPVGSYALAHAQVCTACPPGFSAPINSVSVDACYPVLSSSSPAVCSAPTPAVTSALHCDAGSAPVNGVCKFCPVGSYALAGKQACTHCPAGFSAPINSVSVDACYPVVAAAAPLKASASAVLCAAGSAPVNGVCTFCPVGSYALAGQPSCTHCPTGFSAPINSVSPDACYPVVAAASAAASGSGAAVKAPAHAGSALLCDAGSAPVNGVCTFCPVGTYALAGQKSCTHCPTGYWAPINSVSKDACYPL